MSEAAVSEVPLSGDNGTDLLDRLCAEAERSWIDRRDVTMVDRLAAEHPEHAAELYEFFSALVLGCEDHGVGAVPEGLAREAASRTAAWLEEEGFERAREAARQATDRPRRKRIPRTFVKFLQERCGERPEAIVGRIGGVTWEFLAMVSRYPTLVPDAAANELAERIERAWGIPAAECLARLRASGPVPMAASRRGPRPPAPSSFEELLERSALRGEERARWQELGSTAGTACPTKTGAPSLSGKGS